MRDDTSENLSNVLTIRLYYKNTKLHHQQACSVFLHIFLKRFSQKIMQNIPNYAISTADIILLLFHVQKIMRRQEGARTNIELTSDLAPPRVTCRLLADQVMRLCVKDAKNVSVRM